MVNRAQMQMKNYNLIVLSLLATSLLASCSSFVAIERANHASSDSAFASYLRSENIPITHNNGLEILNGAHAKFEALFEDVRRAKHHIHLEYFNFRNDSINEVFISLLEQKVKEGVEVRAMFDAFGNMSNDRPLKKEHLEAIRAKGINVVKFDPIKFPWFNHVLSRDHRKIVVIDGRIGYIGGINVADYYLQGLEGIGEWRDMHSKVEGAAVDELQKIFLDMWHAETGEIIVGKEYYPEHKAAGSADIAVVDRWPGRTPESIRHAYVNAINAAKDSIVLINPYFMPTSSIKKALKKALKDGVKVSIVISEKGDIPMTPEGTWRAGYKMMKRGAEVHVYTGGFNHSKVMCIDGKFCTIGSANLNSRSLRYDYETNLFVFGKEDTDELNRCIELDKKESYLMTKENYKQRSWWKRFTGWVASLVTPFM